MRNGAFAMPTLTGDLKNKDFRGRDLRGYVFQNADLSGSDFSGAWLDGAVFSNTTAAFCNFDGVTARGVTCSQGNVFFDYSSARGAMFANLNAPALRWRSGDWTGASFDRAEMPGSFLNGTRMIAGSASVANFRASEWCAGSLAYSRMEACDNLNTLMIGTDQTGANWSAAVMAVGGYGNQAISDSFHFDGGRWRIYPYYDAQTPAYDGHPKADFYPLGGLEPGPRGFVRSHSSRWTIDTPEATIFSLIALNANPFDVTGAALDFAARGSTSSGAFSFHILSVSGSRYHLPIAALDLNNWATQNFTLTSALPWVHTWTRPGETIVSIATALTQVANYGFAITGSSGVSTGQLDLANFRLELTPTASSAFKAAHGVGVTINRVVPVYSPSP
jgi:hypothetical protein